MTDNNLEPPPTDFEQFRDMIVARKDSLPKRLAQVGEYAIRNPDDFAFGTAASVSEAIGVQPSTLVRFAKQLGYAGFSDLKDVFRSRIKEQRSSYQDRIRALRVDTEGSAESEILYGFLDAAAGSLAALSRRVEVARFAEAVAILAKADCIYLIARRRAYPLASSMAYTFAKMGLRIVLAGSAPGIDPELIGSATDRDAAIAMSFTPYSSDTVHLARIVAGAGVPLISITDSPFSPIAECARIWFEIAEQDFSGFRSLSASMAFCMALTVAVAEARKQ
ncbi:MurR/RpiR family transcriptional regulator [Rhodospirillum sp. A1_3_36]|uniref:MurR/RpiR family transcriptional regulator n=1 Tax=Rhodospirillum sp. A1_3_36 TaxID=3391666 RepID=UPI0039A5418A